MPEQYKRQTAKKCRIGHLLQGNFVQQEGWDPSYVDTPIGKVSRVNLMAIVVSHDGNNLVLDDGSGKINLRSFGEIALDKFDVGDKVLVIGRPREYNDEMYVAAEIVRKIENDKWLDYRKVEIEMLPKVEVKKKEPVQEVKEETMDEKAEEASEKLKVSDKILDRIRELDEGDGADIDDVIDGMEEGENIMNSLMEEGEVFEIRPGKVKVLE